VSVVLVNDTALSWVGVGGLTPIRALLSVDCATAPHRPPHGSCGGDHIGHLYKLMI
jgi:hypothetical protein